VKKHHEPVIRLAHINDTGSICAINQLTLGYDYGMNETVHRLASILNKPNAKIFTAEVRGHVVGYVHGSDYDCTYWPPLKNILALGVLEQYRGQGIGRLLVAALEEWAKADGCAGVRLVSSHHRTDAHQFYLRCGYTDRKDQKNFIKIFAD